MLTYAFAITFLFGALFGAVLSIYLAYRYFDRQEKKAQSEALAKLEEMATQGPILHPSER